MNIINAYAHVPLRLGVGCVSNVVPCGSWPLLDGRLAQSDMLPIVYEEGVLLVVLYDVVDGGEGEGAHNVGPIGGGVNVEMLTAGGREREKNSVMLIVCLFKGFTFGDEGHPREDKPPNKGRAKSTCTYT